MRTCLVGRDDPLEGMPNHEEPGCRVELLLLPPPAGGRGEGAACHPLTGVVQLGVSLPLGQVLVEICQPENHRVIAP